ncbi:hypothetical protein PR202_gb09900 [Eleusine coracana subsp. coracana]|uniref:BHLH domain-containing protein n=1 Tax=Eleusine coracana subsp. coracana TaxID=191504 RepID=A0AAV5EJ95_ELECO|nr:hypothetical protein QOZ80_2BG0201970 [Eleusine coracana subsp. coracana]GJN22345.1 hypothetical protein PR202_gb09900 [Eleusine coracana subsp. coracana]
MALEAVVFPQEHFACTAANKAMMSSVATHSSASPPGYGIDEFEDKGGVVLQEEALALHGVVGGVSWNTALGSCSVARPAGAMEAAERWDWEVVHSEHQSVSPPPVPRAQERGKAAAASSRRRKRRPKAVKNEEEMEGQRRNHIAVERNRRRQMNEYLAVLRSVMPPSYAQRGDQASIVAGAINFVKELEQTLQSLEAQKRGAEQQSPSHQEAPPPFAGFFTFPQYSTGAFGVAVISGGDDASSGSGGDHHHQCAAARRGAAEIEVAVAESHANVKVLTRRRPRQLLKMAGAMQCLGLTVLHLNVTTTADDNLAFYSFSLKMEDECRLSSVDEIASAVNEIVAKISDEGAAAGHLSAA